MISDSTLYFAMKILKMNRLISISFHYNFPNRKGSDWIEYEKEEGDVVD